MAAATAAAAGASARTKLLLLLATLCGQACALEDLAFNAFREATLPAGAPMHHVYRVWLNANSMPDVKVVLLPLSGDADVLVSFDASIGDASVGVDASVASWSLSGIGMEELLLRRELFCHTQLEAASPGAGGGGGGGGGGRSASAPPMGRGCYLYLRVRSSDERERISYKLAVLHAHDPFNARSECHPGCAPALLANRACDAACNVTACAFDRGRCVPVLAGACSAGCSREWLADGYCDDECFTSECEWDAGDCEDVGDLRGCADSCLRDYIDDGECDRACNVAECGWDGLDCDHGHGECYEKPRGEDYRGGANTTVSGRACQRWGAQFPQQHFFTHARYPQAGLGAHAACRNPGGVHDAPWCYTTDPLVRWERCATPPPSGVGSCARGGGESGARRPAHAPRGPSACERHCPLTFAAITSAGDCEALVDCDCGGDPCAVNHTDPCRVERRTCAKQRSTRDRLTVVIWASLAGTAAYVLALVCHARRFINAAQGAPHDPSPRGRALGAYMGLAYFAGGDDGGGGGGRGDREIREVQLLDAERAGLFDRRDSGE